MEVRQAANKSSRLPDETDKKLWRRLRFFQVLSAGLALILAGAGAWVVLDYLDVHYLDFGLVRVGQRVPHRKEVVEIIKPLQYSGVKTLLRPDVNLSVDFEKKTWTLHNVRRYDADGRVVLDEGRFGVCGELAHYTYQKIRSLFEKRYVIQFVRVSESSYFRTEKSVHYAILILDSEAPPARRVFILDPSFHRYGILEDFEDYRFYETGLNFPFGDPSYRDSRFRVGSGTPLFIKDQYMIELMVLPIKGRFDPDNLDLTLQATHRGNYTGRRMLSLVMVDGKKQVFEDRKLALKRLGRRQYEQIKKRLDDFFEAFIRSAPAKTR